MTQVDPATEIQSLKAQLNALTQVVLHTVAILEMNNLVHGPHLEAELRKKNFPEPLNDEARSAVNELCDQIESARNRRQELEQQQESQNHSEQ
jgi:hypothetical protein